MLNLKIYSTEKSFKRKINQLIFTNDVGVFSTSLDLKTRYSDIQLTNNAIRLNMIILLWE